MKAFIKLTFFFIFLFLSVITLIVISTSLIERKKANFILKSNPKYIVLGHSHPECAFNDSLMPSLKNISESGESYFYNYIKIKPVILQNPSIEVVFVEYTNNQINEGMDEWIWGEKYMSNRFPRYSSFMSFGDNVMLFKNNSEAYSNSLSLSVKKKTIRIFNDDLNYSNKIGGYLYLERDKTDSIIKNMSSLKQSKNKNRNFKKEISEVNLLYLDSIITFIERQNKKVVLIRSPLHDKYKGYENEEAYIEILKTRYANSEYMDFSKFPLLNSMYGDLEHLNYKGAKEFTEWFADLINDGLLEKENKQDYIDEKITHIKVNYNQ
ncbi:hypothetical protein [Lacinutrix undariae]